MEILLKREHKLKATLLFYAKAPLRTTLHKRDPKLRIELVRPLPSPVGEDWRGQRSDARGDSRGHNRRLFYLHKTFQPIRYALRCDEFAKELLIRNPNAFCVEKTDVLERYQVRGKT